MLNLANSNLDLLWIESSNLNDMAAGVKGMFIFAAGFLITWAPSLAIRHLILKERAPRWISLLIAFLTFLLGMVVGTLMTGADRPGIHGAAAICAYLTVRRSE